MLDFITILRLVLSVYIFIGVPIALFNIAAIWQAAQILKREDNIKPPGLEEITRIFFLTLFFWFWYAIRSHLGFGHRTPTS